MVLNSALLLLNTKIVEKQDAQWCVDGRSHATDNIKRPRKRDEIQLTQMKKLIDLNWRVYCKKINPTVSVIQLDKQRKITLREK